MKIGDYVTAYWDYQEETRKLGYVKLLRKIKEGLPFLLKDYDLDFAGNKIPIPLNKQEVFTYEEWEAKIVDNPINNNCYYPKNSLVRVKIKKPYKAVKIEEDLEDYNLNENLLIDKFNDIF